MKNWKTTIAGVLIALTTLQIELNAGASLMDWKEWILPVLIAVFGFLAKDAGVTGASIVAMFAAFLLPSCGITMGANGKPTFSLDAVALAQFVKDWQRTNGAKDSVVIIVPSPQGEALVATSPDGKVTTEVINPSGVIVPPIK